MFLRLTQASRRLAAVVLLWLPATLPAAAPTVRVSLVEKPIARLTVAVAGGYRLRLVGSTTELGSGRRLPPTRVQATPSGLLLGTLRLSATWVELLPSVDGTLRVGGNRYRGRLWLFRRPGGLVRPVNVVSLPGYLASVVDSEMPATFPDAARRAQAIVARTYVAMRLQARRRGDLFDVYATTRSQKYQGLEYIGSKGRRLAGESAASRRLVGETAGMVCAYSDQASGGGGGGGGGDRLFTTWYTACCGGRTAVGRAIFPDAAPPLKSVACRWCGEAPLFRWSVRRKLEQVAKPLHGPLVARQRSFGRLRQISTRASGQAGRPPRVICSDGTRTVELPALTVQRALGAATLRSPFFEISLQQGDVTFAGRGHGHGTGMCQWGAAGQARQGRNCRQILAHYYPGSHIVLMPTLVSSTPTQ